MRKWTIAILSVALVVTIGVAFWSAETTKRDGDAAANIISGSGTPVGGMWSSKQSESRFAKVFKAPFRAARKVGNILLGRDKDKEVVLLERINEKDQKKFEKSDLSRADKLAANAAPPASASMAQEHLTQGRGLLDREKINEAVAELSLAVSLDPQLGEAHNLLGVAYDRKGLRQRARESYERALRTAPSNVQVINNLGYSLYLDGNYRAAVKRLKQAVKLAPNDQRSLNNLALAQSRLGKYDEAFKTFERAGGELNGRLNTAAMLERAGRDKEAIEHYEAARRLDPKSATVLRRLADLYARTGRRDEAEAAGRVLLAMPETEVAAGKGSSK